METSMTCTGSTSAVAGAPTLERLPKVKARTGLSRSAIYRLVANRQFPAPVKLGERASGWSAHEVDQWIAERIAERDAKAVV